MTRKLFEGTFDHASSYWHSLLVFFVTTVSRRGRTTYAKGRIIRASNYGHSHFSGGDSSSYNVSKRK